MGQFTETPLAPSSARPLLALFDPDAPAKVEPVPAKSNKTRKSKSAKDRDFPLWLHPSGRWCRKIHQRFHYFGSDKEAALQKWLDEKDDLLAGRTPRPKGDWLVVGDLCERFLNAKRALVESNELSPRTFGQYHSSCKKLVAHFGKHRRVDDLSSEDFESLRAAVSKTCGPVAIANEIRLVRIICRYGYEAGLISAPLRFGPTFKVKRETIRKEAAQRPPRMFDAATIRRLLAAADPQMTAWILLGINCAFGQADLAALPRSAIDLKAGAIEFPRPKTGVPRKCFLWPETVASLRKVMEDRPEPKESEDADCVFLTHHRNRLVRATKKFGHRDAVSPAFGRLLDELKLKQPGLQFYALRHTFRTVADATKDVVAIDRIMGHADHSMGGRYRQRIDDDRLKAVTNSVRVWLFPRKVKSR